jgi:hypothetical protein
VFYKIGWLRCSQTINPGGAGKELQVVISKNGVTRKQFIALLQYSLLEECQFTLAVKPKTNIRNDHKFQIGSVIRFLKVEESVHCYVESIGEEECYAPLFTIKVCVEDRYWEKLLDSDGDVHTLSGIVPSAIRVKVAEILG